MQIYGMTRFMSFIIKPCILVLFSGKSIGTSVAYCFGMRIAISHWQNRISPVFDVAAALLLVNIDESMELTRENRMLVSSAPLRRAQEVVSLGTDVLICGAISLILEMALTNAGIKVTGFVSGNIDEIIKAFLNGDLANPRYFMPGMCAQRRRNRT